MSAFFKEICLSKLQLAIQLPSRGFGKVYNQHQAMLAARGAQLLNGGRHIRSTGLLQKRQGRAVQPVGFTITEVQREGEISSCNPTVI